MSLSNGPQSYTAPTTERVSIPDDPTNILWFMSIRSIVVQIDLLLGDYIKVGE